MGFSGIFSIKNGMKYSMPFWFYNATNLLRFISIQKIYNNQIIHIPNVLIAILYI